MSRATKSMASKAVDWPAVLRFLPVFERSDFVFSEWITSANTFPYCNYNDDVVAFMTALYDAGVVADFNWPDWQQDAEIFVADRKKVAEADLWTLQRLLTLHVRKERFCEGHLDAMLKSEHITAILRRIAEIHSA